MKKIVAFAFCIFCFAIVASAQVTTPISTTKKVVTKSDSTKPQTLLPVNTVVPKLPDIRIISLAFAIVNSSVQPNGETIYTFSVNYTVKNEGTVAVDANDITMGGRWDYNPNFNRPDPGCGGGFQVIKGQVMLQPGATIAGWYRCTLTFDRNHPPYYRLIADLPNRIKELNEDNNSVTTTIIF